MTSLVLFCVLVAVLWPSLHVRDWQAVHRRVGWWLGGFLFAPRGVKGPPRTAMQRLRFEREWDRRWKQGRGS